MISLKINHLHTSLRIFSNRYSKIYMSMCCVIASWKRLSFSTSIPHYVISINNEALLLEHVATCVDMCMEVHIQLRIWENFNAEICPCKMTKPYLSSCIEFSLSHKPVVSFRHRSYGQLTDNRYCSLLKKDVLLSKRAQPHRHKDRHAGNNYQQQPSVCDFVWRWRQKRSHKRQ